MNNRTISLILIFVCTLSFVRAENGRVAEGDRAVLRESPKRLVGWIDASIEEVSLSAAINVVRDAAQKRVRVFATAWPGKRVVVTKVGEFEVETVWNPDLSSKEVPACYHRLHTAFVLALAGSLIASDKKDDGLALVRLVAKAQPKFYYNAEEPPVTVEGLLESLEKSDQKAESLVKELKQRWDWNRKRAGGEN